MVKAVATIESSLGSATPNLMGVSTPDANAPGGMTGVSGITPQASAQQGAQILAQGLKYTNGNVPLALVYYNQGPGAVNWIKSHGYGTSPAQVEAGNMAYYKATGGGSGNYVRDVLSILGSGPKMNAGG